MERKELIEMKANKDQQEEDKMVHDLLMERRQKTNWAIKRK